MLSFFLQKPLKYQVFSWVIYSALMAPFAKAIELSPENDFSWLYGCEIAGDGFDYNLIYEDLVKKDNPNQYQNLLKSQAHKEKTLQSLKNAKDKGYLCYPMALIKFTIKISALDKSSGTIKFEKLQSPYKFMVDKGEFSALPRRYTLTILNLAAPEEVNIPNHKIHSLLARCSELHSDGTATLNVGVLFDRRGRAQYDARAVDGNVTLNCANMPGKKYELISFEYDHHTKP